MIVQIDTYDGFIYIGYTSHTWQELYDYIAKAAALTHGNDFPVCFDQLYVKKNNSNTDVKECSRTYHYKTMVHWKDVAKIVELNSYELVS